MRRLLKYVTALERFFQLLLIRQSQHVCLCPDISTVTNTMEVCNQVLAVNEYVRLGHRISANLDDQSDILSNSRHAGDMFFLNTA